LLWGKLKHSLKTGDLWHFAFYFAWLSLIFSFTYGAIPSIVAERAPGDDTAYVYTNFVFPFVSNATFLVAPFVGFCIDKRGFRFVFAACLLLTQLFLLTLLIPVFELQVCSYVVSAMAQACLYSLQFAYISTFFCTGHQIGSTLQVGEIYI
jgi:MFS family permease